MKLKPDFIPMNIGEIPYLVPLGGFAFQGVIRGNSTAGFILEQLKNEITEAELVDAICGEYDAPRDSVSEDVAEIIRKLRKIGALED